MALVVNAETDVFLCCEGDIDYMREYVQSITGKAASLVVYNWKESGVLSDSTKRYICFRRVPFDILPPETDTPVVFINTEQLSVPWKMVEFKAYAASPRVGLIFDYSKENIRLANGRSHFLPLKESVEETDHLRALIEEHGGGRGADFACVGSPTQHRIQIMNGLRSRGLRIDFIQGFGEERDIRVARCRFLLNLHAGGDYKLWEPLRCNRWLHAGLPVISEPCLDAFPRIRTAAGEINEVTIAAVDDLDTLSAKLRETLASLPPQGGFKKDE